VGNTCKQGEDLWLGWSQRKLGGVPIGDGLGREARVGLAGCGVCDSVLEMGRINRLSSVVLVT
jgi:hypothetical protein